ncbi:hypothetical protein D3C73_1317980 [compost metagenome]
MLAACCNSFGVDSTNVFTRMMKNGATIDGRMYARKLLVRCRDLMVRYQGIMPALKNIVIMVNLYQNFFPHISSWANMKPKKAEAPTVKMVPITVLPIEMTNAFHSPGILNTST